MKECVTVAAKLAAFLAVGALFGQAQDLRPAYEVATVRLNTSGSSGSSMNGDKAQIIFTNVTLKSLVEQAYGVQEFQVNGPGWMEDVRFDIAAKYPPNVKNQERPLMLRTLLQDQMKLSAHRESKMVAGYALVVAKAGFKLKPAEAEETHASTTRNGIVVKTVICKEVSMTFLAERLSRWLGQIVIDKSGVAGAYDFQFRYTNDDQSQPASDAEDAPSLFTALQETLGVRLQPEKVPVEMILIDQLERTPSQNR